MRGRSFMFHCVFYYIFGTISSYLLAAKTSRIRNQILTDQNIFGPSAVLCVDIACRPLQVSCFFIELSVLFHANGRHFHDYRIRPYIHCNSQKITDFF